MENIEERGIHNYCVIMAGGRGRRLWPVSRPEKPKQFVDFFGVGRTLLQQTYDRIAGIIPKGNIYIATHADYKETVMAQLPDVDYDNILLEPIHRGTAPVVAWAMHRIAMKDEQAALLVTPADQMIVDTESFRQDVLQGLSHAQVHQCLLTMGIRPTRAEPGYGYLQMGEPTGNGVYKVQSFTEKPSREFAEMFINSEEFLWNTGLYISTVKHMMQCLHELMPDVMQSFERENYIQSYKVWKEENLWIERNYTRYPNQSIENGILEKSEHVCVKECHFGWMDVGSWHGIFDSYANNADDNVLMGTEAIINDAHGNIVCLKDGRKAVIQGLENFVVAEHDDVLLIVPRSDSSNNVIRMLNKYENN